MPKDLLEKFDKDFDLQWAEDDVPRLRKFAKSLAHYHIEAAYEKGVKDGSGNPMYQSDPDGKNVRMIECDKCQSNLERLIEKCGYCKEKFSGSIWEHLERYCKETQIKRRN